MAHEFAHWLLHRDCSIHATREKEQLPDDGDDAEDIDQSVLGWSGLEWLEWQASKLAAALLIPSVAVRIAILPMQRDMGIVLNQGIIFENPTPGNRLECEEQIARVAKSFDVSKTVTRFRLLNLGFYPRRRQIAKPRTPRPASTA